MVRSSFVVALVAFFPTTAAAQVWNPAMDFSAINNPNGVWSYGWAGGPFVLDTSFHNSSALDFWVGPDAGGSGDEYFPYVAHNGTNTTINYHNIEYPPGQLGMYPGPLSEESLIRWTVPTALSVLVTGQFYGLDPLATTDVHVYKNGNSVFDGSVNGANRVPFSLSITVLAGDHIAFGAGWGNQDNSNDSTGLTATISAPVPEPTGLAMLGLVVLAAPALRTRRREPPAVSHPLP